MSEPSFRPGDRVVVLDVFGKPTGIYCTVKEAERTARRKISSAQKACWAKLRTSLQRSNRMSAAARRKVSLAQKARWAKVKVAQQVTTEGDVEDTFIGTYRKHKFKIYPTQTNSGWTAMWTLFRPDGKREEFPARGEFDTMKGATDAARRDAEERVRLLERGERG
ncbi:MAG: hypothetical protein M3O09_03660 [Acidobacteriota bacterium]|nr:hypothetical protein [Acidobacteriota bacterium]